MMNKIVRFKQMEPKKANGISTILAAMLCAGVVGYFGPGLFGKQPITNTTQVITSSTVETIVGRASVVDGDTIKIHGERIRFNGIDAPESSQLCKDGSSRDYRCGAKSANALAEFLAASSPTRCEFVERDQYGRFVGNCFRADNKSVQRWLVRNGHAMDWPRYSQGAFSNEQRSAQTEKVGIWQGGFQVPWEWRAAQRETTNSSIMPLMTTTGGGGCNIKGNISKHGERIYHVPGQRFYAKTRISASKGERWFCSEDEAQAAGWRPAKR